VLLVLTPPAILEIDGRPYKDKTVGTPTVTLPVGTHTFTLSLPDYGEKISLRRTVTTSTKSITLDMPVGLLTVFLDQTAPPGGVAFLDGKRLGTVPFRIKKVPSGEHELEVIWDGTGHSPYRQKITIQQLRGGSEVTTVVAMPPE